MRNALVLAHYKLGKRLDRIADTAAFQRIASPSRGIRFLRLKLLWALTRLY